MHLANIWNYLIYKQSFTPSWYVCCLVITAFKQCLKVLHSNPLRHTHPAKTNPKRTPNKKTRPEAFSQLKLVLFSIWSMLYQNSIVSMYSSIHLTSLLGEGPTRYDTELKLLSGCYSCNTARHLQTHLKLCPWLYYIHLRKWCVHESQPGNASCSLLRAFVFRERLMKCYYFFSLIKQKPPEMSLVGSKIPSVVEVSAFWQHDSVLCIFNLTAVQFFLVNLRPCKHFCACLSFSQMILQLGFLSHVELNTGKKVWKIKTSEETNPLRVTS